MSWPKLRNMRAGARRPLWLRLILLLIAASLFVVGYQWGNRVQSRNTPLPDISGVLLRPPADIPGFTLQDARGRSLDQNTLASGWTLLAFGDLRDASGQLAIQRLVQIFNRAGEHQALQRALRIALVLPAPDLMRAREFSSLSPALWIASGDAAEVTRLRTALQGGDTPAPGTLYLFGPGGVLLALFPDSEDAAQVAGDLATIHAHAPQLLPDHS